MCKFFRQRGFSLIETIVYIALFSYIFVALLSTMTSTVNIFTQLRIARDINDSSVKIMERLTRSIQNSSSIDYVNSSFDVDPGKITLNELNASGTQMVSQYYVQGGELRVKENGVDLGSIMTGRTKIDGLVFRSLQTGSIRAVKIELHVSESRGRVINVGDFYDTAILRGSY